MFFMSYETIADTRWGKTKVSRSFNSTKTVNYRKPLAIVAELPIRAAGSVIPFLLGAVVGEVLEHTPVIEQYTSPSTSMLFGIVAGAIGFAKSGINLDDNMQVEGVSIQPITFSATRS